MASEVIMPALEMAQDFGKLLNWRKAEGEQVEKGEPLMEIETDKVTVEIEAPASGILARVSAAPGDMVPVGQVIALILAPDEVGKPGMAEPAHLSDSTQPTPTSEQVPDKQGDAKGQSSSTSTPVSPLAARIAAENRIDLRQIRPSGPRIEKSDVLAYLDSQTPMPSKYGSPRLSPASPKARRLAKERGVDIDDVPGNGPGGAVLAGDVLAASAEPQPTAESIAPPAEPKTSSVAISNIWRVMVERVTQSWTSVPHFYLAREVHAHRLQSWREAAAGRFDGNLTYTDLLVKIVAESLKQHPRLNASWQEGEIQIHREINLGLAVAVEDGLIVPVIHRAGDLTLRQIVERRREIVRRAREGKLYPEDIRGGTFTISNLGMYGIDVFNAIINPPQAGILALGRITDRVIALDGQPAVEPMMTMSLSCDHRVVDGARGAQFLATIAEIIQDPLRLVE